MLFGKNKWKIKYKELKKRYDELFKNYSALYSKLENPAFMRDVVRRVIHHNLTNIKNYNSRDQLYHTRKYVCLDGQKVRSKVEREIYNYLILNGVKVRYEAVYKTPWGSFIRPDFYLPEYQLYIEYFGKDIGEDEKYDEIMKFKKELYEYSYAPFVILNHHDEENLYKVLKTKLSKHIDVSNWI